MIILNPIDFKNYIYCPRQVFFKYINGIQEETYKMKYGKLIHNIFERKEAERTLKKYNLENYTREFNIKIFSKEYGISGTVDMTLENDNEIIPVDFKMNKSIIIDGYIMQLYTYSICLEKTFIKKSSYGFIYFISQNEVKKIDFNTEVKNKFEEIREKINYMIVNEKMPNPPENLERCNECEYINFCGDIE